MYFLYHRVVDFDESLHTINHLRIPTISLAVKHRQSCMGKLHDILASQTCRASMVPDLESWLQERNLLTQLIQQLLHAQQKMKAQADFHPEWVVQIGDMVYLKLEPHVLFAAATTYLSVSMGHSKYCNVWKLLPTNWICLLMLKFMPSCMFLNWRNMFHLLPRLVQTFHQFVLILMKCFYPWLFWSAPWSPRGVLLLPMSRCVEVICHLVWQPGKTKLICIVDIRWTSLGTSCLTRSVGIDAQKKLTAWQVTGHQHPEAAVWAHGCGTYMFNK